MYGWGRYPTEFRGDGPGPYGQIVLGSTPICDIASAGL